MISRRLKKKWVKALLSRRHKQGSGHLFDGRTWCCLGVLGHCAGRSTANLTGSDYLYGKGFSYAYLPEEIQSGFASMNDDKVPFEVIAGFIEENLPTRGRACASR